jgi:fused signal recognition particle receptor
MFGFFRKKTPPPSSLPEPDVSLPATPDPEPPLANPADPLPVQASDTHEPIPTFPPSEPPPQTPSALPLAALPDAKEATHERPSWAQRLKAGLARTRSQLGLGLSTLFGLRKIDEDLLEELESTLLMADCGMEATQHLMQTLRERWKKENLQTAQELQGALAQALLDLLLPLEHPLKTDTVEGPFIVMLAGINGSGKTTSIGKLAKHIQAQGQSVLLAAGDTFRAAAREQLTTWGERNGIAVIAQEGGDPGAVIFDAVMAAKARGIDVVLADTAGRLPTQLHLMDEIAKVKRVIAKALPGAPHEVLLVLDANIGQNALAQVTAFDKAVGVTGLILTKLDGTAKGGVVAAIARQCPKPLRFIGVGEGIDDLQAFQAKPFVDALFEPVQKN